MTQLSAKCHVLPRKRRNLDWPEYSTNFIPHVLLSCTIADFMIVLIFIITNNMKLMSPGNSHYLLIANYYHPIKILP